MSEHLSGGCLCGEIRYEITGKPLVVFHCHCTICRRAGSSAYVTWVGVSRGKGRVTHGEPKVFASSAEGRRGFCPTCGAQINFVFENNTDQIYFTAATLDDPNAVAPDSHGYIGETVRWLHIEDNLPEYDADPTVIGTITG